MKNIVSLVLFTALISFGCSSTNNSRDFTNLDSATNYPMQVCPESDLATQKSFNDLPNSIFPCLGHDKNVNLAGLPTGKPLVVSLWASWCVYCEDDAPAFIAAKNKFNEINFIGINYQDQEAAAIASAARWKLPFPSIVDSQTALQSHYQISGLPITIIYDAAGFEVGRINGPIGTAEEFINYLEVLLNN